MEGKVFYYFGQFWEILAREKGSKMWLCRSHLDGSITNFEDEVIRPLLARNKFWG